MSSQPHLIYIGFERCCQFCWWRAPARGGEDWYWMILPWLGLPLISMIVIPKYDQLYNHDQMYQDQHKWWWLCLPFSASLWGSPGCSVQWSGTYLCLAGWSASPTDLDLTTIHGLSTSLLPIAYLLSKPFRQLHPEILSKFNLRCGDWRRRDISARSSLDEIFGKVLTFFAINSTCYSIIRKTNVVIRGQLLSLSVAETWSPLPWSDFHIWYLEKHLELLL